LQIIFYGSKNTVQQEAVMEQNSYLCRTLYPKRKKKFICKKP